MKFNEKWAKFSKNGKLTLGLIGVICLVAIIGGGTVYASNQSQKKIVTETQAKLDTATDNLSKLNKKVQALFDSKDKNYLAKNVTEEQVKELERQAEKERTIVSKETSIDNKILDKVSFTGYDKVKNDVDEQLKKAEKMVATQSTINLFFNHDEKTQAMNGIDIKKDLPIVDNLKKETIETAKKDIGTKKEVTSFEQTVNDLLKNAQDQVNQIEKAKSEVEKVFKDGKVVSTDKKLYENAKTETNKIKNEKAKKSLLDQLTKVKSDLDKKEKEESEKVKTAEETKQEEAKKADSIAKADTGQSNDSTATNTQQATADNGYTPTYDGGNQDGSTGGGSQGGGNQSGSTGGGSQGGGNQGGSTGGGSQGGGNQGGSTGGGSQIPDGWIVPPYPIGSDELWNWLMDNGYSGFDSADGYIRPY